MAQNWDYAELSKDAKVAGGPEKYVEMLELASKEAGKMEMLPWLGVAAVGASLLAAAITLLERLSLRSGEPIS